MNSYVSKSACCGSTKTLTNVEKAACCDCPVMTSEFSGGYSLKCGTQIQIYNSNTSGTLFGMISLSESTTECGLEVTFTSNNQEIIRTIPPANADDPDNNVISFSYANVTDITAICTGGGGENCKVNYSFRTIERCISTSLPNQ
ncbi:S-Ena type endospore appendage [Cytobacillus sp. Hm23]